jgi:hypothetical protein
MYDSYCSGSKNSGNAYWHVGDGIEVIELNAAFIVQHFSIDLPEFFVRRSNAR